jgi:hypothetical protein
VLIELARREMPSVVIHRAQVRRVDIHEREREWHSGALGALNLHLDLCQPHRAQAGSGELVDSRELALSLSHGLEAVSHPRSSARGRRLRVSGSLRGGAPVVSRRRCPVGRGFGAVFAGPRKRIAMKRVARRQIAPRTRGPTELSYLVARRLITVTQPLRAIVDDACRFNVLIERFPPFGCGSAHRNSFSSRSARVAEPHPN